jgi:hypothetical protein
MSAGRSLQVGDKATVQWETGKSPVEVIITARCDDGSQGPCQSGIMFQCSPILSNGMPDGWVDADWFDPVTTP